MDALHLQGLRAGYGRGPDVVRDIDLQVKQGEIVAILGPSGGGKSTILKAVAGLANIRGGTMDLLGVRHPVRPLRGSIGYIPQRLGLVRHTSVLDNVEHGGLHTTTMVQSLLHRVPAEITRRSHDALEAVGLADKGDWAIHQLSGGQQRRVAIARALVQQPRLMLADEFLGELDPATVDLVAGAVRQLRDDHNTTVVMVEHRLDQAMDLADRVFRLEQGRLDEVTEIRGAT